MILLITACIIDDDHYTVEVFAEYLEILGVKVVSVGYDGKMQSIFTKNTNQTSYFWI